MSREILCKAESDGSRNFLVKVSFIAVVAGLQSIVIKPQLLTVLVQNEAPLSMRANFLVHERVHHSVLRPVPSDETKPNAISPSVMRRNSKFFIYLKL